MGLIPHQKQNTFTETFTKMFFWQVAGAGAGGRWQVAGGMWQVESMVEESVIRMVKPKQEGEATPQHLALILPLQGGWFTPRPTGGEPLGLVQSIR